MDHFDIIKSIIYGFVVVSGVVVTVVLSIRLSIKSKQNASVVKWSEFLDIFALVRDWCGSYELMPKAKKCATNMK